MHCLKEKRFPDRSSVWQASISQFILFILFCAQGRCLRSQGWHETIPRYQLASLRNRCANAEYRRSSYIYNVFILPLESHNFLHLSLQSFDFIVQPCSLLPRMRCPDFADLTPIDLQALIWCVLVESMGAGWKPRIFNSFAKLQIIALYGCIMQKSCLRRRCLCIFCYWPRSWVSYDNSGWIQIHISRIPREPLSNDLVRKSVFTTLSNLDSPNCVRAELEAVRLYLFTLITSWVHAIAKQCIRVTLTPISPSIVTVHLLWQRHKRRCDKVVIWQGLCDGVTKLRYVVTLSQCLLYPRHRASRPTRRWEVLDNIWTCVSVS